MALIARRERIWRLGRGQLALPEAVRKVGRLGLDRCLVGKV
jgi:hypothetical protein